MQSDRTRIRIQRRTTTETATKQGQYRQYRPICSYIYTYKAPPPFSQTRPTSRSLWRCAGAFWSLLFLFNGRRRRLAGETEAAAILPSLGFRLPILHLHRDCEFRFPKSPCSYMKVLKLGLWFFFFFNIGLKFVAFDICLLSLV